MCSDIVKPCKAPLTTPATGSRVVSRKGSPFGVAHARGHLRRWQVPAGHRAVLGAMTLVAASAGLVGAPAAAGSATPIAAYFGFYSDIADPIRDAFSGTTATPDVRPSSVMLAERGGTVLDDLRWSGWGTSVARATGSRVVYVYTSTWADGKDVKQPGRVTLTLSNPGVILGRMVYRCFKIDPPDPRDDPADHGCLRPMGGGGLYDYE